MTLPIVMWMGGFGFWAALAVNIGFTVFYAAYTYIFHIVFDWLRPMRREEVSAPLQIPQPANDQLPSGRRRAA